MKVEFIAEIINHTQKKMISNDKSAKLTLEYTAEHETISKIDKLFQPERLIKVILEEENE